MKKLIKMFLPLLLIKYRMRPKWVGRYKNFHQISKRFSYENLNIADKCFDSAEKVFLGEFPFERDGYLFNKIEYSFGLLSSLFYIGNSCKKISIIDFGGGFGTTFIQNKILESFFPIDWSVVEQKNYVDKAKSSNVFNAINFYEDIEFIKIERFNAILFSSVLQYLEDPKDLLNKICKLKIKYLIIDRTPILNSSIDSFVTRQVNDIKVQDSSYPCWQFSETDLLRDVESHYSQIFKWKSEIDESNLDAKFCGYLYRLNE